MGNRAGQAYGLTLLSPILRGADALGRGHALALRDELRALYALPESPLASVPTTHLARWVLIDDVPYEGLPAKEDRLRSKYLLFTSNFDGELADYVELLRTRIPDTIDRLYRHCVGYPGVGDRAAFHDYVRRCQVETTFFFGAYPDAPAEQVLRALDLQWRMGQFVETQQDAQPAPDQLQQAFRDFLAEVRSAPTPRPGTP